MEERDLLSLVGNELSNSQHHQDWHHPLDYYLGNPNGTEIEGRSAVVSTDVADAVEWIMPQVMKSFTQNNEVVTFDPLSEEDEAQAEIESAYVYDVLMKQNDGFIILHTFVKDALLFNNGLIKVYYEENGYDASEYTGLAYEQVVGITQDPSVEVLETSQAEDQTFAIKLRVKIPGGKITVEAVPLENFRYNSDHDSINLDEARFTAHVTTKTVSDLLEEGYDPALLDELGDEHRTFESAYRFAAQGEQYQDKNWSDDPSLREVGIAECYMRADLNGDGIAERVKITVAGYETPTHILSVEEIDYSPWVSTTAILMPHKWRGLSIYDRLKQIQDQKTSLLRSILDNTYLQNNQRMIIVEGQVNRDDAQVSRPGGIIRVKRPDAIVPLVTPPLGPDALNMMEYMDRIRAGRVGVDPEGSATPQNVGAHVGSEGVQQLMGQREELVGLIVRVMAETGIKPLCIKIRDLCTRHVDSIQNFKFRGQWRQIQPSQWPMRNSTTVRVGTGSGNQQSKREALSRIIDLHGAMMQIPGQTLVNPTKVYAALDEWCDVTELNGASRYFVDPGSPEGQQTAQQAAQQGQQQQMEQQQQQQQMMEFQAKLAEAEMQKAQAAQQTVAVKATVEQQKNEIAGLKAQIDQMKAAVDNANKSAELELKRFETVSKIGLELTKLEATQANAQLDREYQSNADAVSAQ